MEQVDVYDLNKKRTGRVLPREGIFENLAGDARILLVHTCVFDADHRMLIQQRKETKTYCPGCWDVSAGGFVLAGEGSLEAAVRETEEELGLKLPAESLDYVCCEPFGKVLDDFYNVCVDADIRSLCLQESEVKGVAWADRDTVLRMIRDGRFVDYSEELIAGVFDKAGQAGHKASMKSKYFGELSTKELYEILTNIRAVSGDTYADAYPKVSELEDRYISILKRALEGANLLHLNLPLGVDPKDTARLILDVQEGKR